jgi:hypothetical protein
VREQYRTSRALTFEDHTTSCLVHLIDVGDGRLLCLHGQDYYDFEPHDDEPDDPKPRRFPTSEFSLLRHTKKRSVLALLPGATVVEPTVCAPLVKQRKVLRELGLRLEDGELISGVSLETVQRALGPAVEMTPKGV